MNINEAFPSKYLKAADIKGHPPVPVQISHVTMEKMPEGEERPVLWFIGKEKGVVLNKTNANMIAHAYGPETAGWGNKTIYLRCEAVPFGGNIVDSIRVGINAVGAMPEVGGQTTMGVDVAQQYADEQAATAQDIYGTPPSVTKAMVEINRRMPEGGMPDANDFVDDELNF